MLAVVTSIRLLGKSFATCFDDWARTEAAGLKTHQDAMGAAEAEDVSSAHGGEAGELVSIVSVCHW
jgi:hypothetical protein